MQSSGSGFRLQLGHFREFDERSEFESHEVMVFRSVLLSRPLKVDNPSTLLGTTMTDLFTSVASSTGGCKAPMGITLYIFYYFDLTNNGYKILKTYSKPMDSIIYGSTKASFSVQVEYYSVDNMNPLDISPKIIPTDIAALLQILFSVS